MRSFSPDESRSTSICFPRWRGHSGLYLVFLFLSKGYGAGVQVVIRTYHSNRSSLDFLLKDGFGGAQAVHHIVSIRFDSGFHAGATSSLHRGLYGGDDRIDVRRGFSFRVKGFLGRLDRAAALVTQNDDELGAQMLDRILDAAEDVIIEDVARDADDE